MIQAFDWRFFRVHLYAIETVKKNIFHDHLPCRSSRNLLHILFRLFSIYCDQTRIGKIPQPTRNLWQNQSISICNTGRLSLSLRRCIGNENRKKTAKPKIGARTHTVRECAFMSDPWGLVSLNLYYWRLRLFLIPSLS